MGWFFPSTRAATLPPPPSYSDRDHDESQQVWDDSTSGADFDARPVGGGGGRSDVEDDDDEDAPDFVNPDTVTAIRAVRLLLLGALVMAGALVTASVYLLTARNLEQDANVDVTIMSRRVTRTVSERVISVLGDMDLLATDIRLAADASETPWPLITIPHYEERVSKVRRLHRLNKVILLAAVTEGSREMWNRFSVTHHDEWFNESLAYYSRFETSLLSSNSRNVTDHASCDEEGRTNATATTRLSAAQWSPPFSYDGDVDTCLTTTDQLRTAYKALSSGLASFGAELSEQALDTSNRTLGDTEPGLTIAYPIVDPSSKVVAILLAVVPWKNLLKRAVVEGETALVSVILPSNEHAVVVFQVDHLGASVVGISNVTPTVGSGPQQLPQHLSSVFEEEWNARADVAPVDGSGFLAVHVDWVAATTATAENPTLYAVVVILFFLFCIILFVVYDRLAQKQRRQVMKHAKRNFQIVKSLFPARVRDRLLEQQEQATTSSRHTKISLETKSNRAVSELGDRLSVADLEHGRDASESSDATRTAENTSLPGSPTKSIGRQPPKRRLRSFLRDRENFSGFPKEDDDASIILPNAADQKPIADLFPSCTVLFADIAGFTAWSSERDPTQVFMLLGGIYSAFDKVARRRKVFKARTEYRSLACSTYASALSHTVHRILSQVETIGDSYVAVTGLPDPQPDHAWIMAQFALDCRHKMREVTRKLERTLGPETGDLDMRFGLHSGAVTAGVLVGERARFQLFGDSVNTASRMESTGMRNCIQVSGATAALLNDAGKGHWLVKREGTVSVKGKGEMQTYWLEPREESSPRRRASLISNSSGQSVSTPPAPAVMMPDLFNGGKPIRGMLQAQKTTTVWGTSEVFDTMPPALTRCSSDPTYRLIDWNVDVLLRLLKQVVFHRSRRSATPQAVDESTSESVPSLVLPTGTKALDEVAEIIDLPSFDPLGTSTVVDDADTDAVELDEEIEIELRDYVTAIASMYRDNFFHNFEHACHVQMSMIKLLQRVVTPDDIDEEGERSTQDAYTYGIIASDPLTQFAVVFSALIHDVDHCGVANGQLIKENSPIATYYNGKSVAEQNSIDLAWELLMDEKFESLRGCIYTTEGELKRFRQLVVNVVLATDIFDKELSALRKNRWSRAFPDPTQLGELEAAAMSEGESHVDQVNRKATIVLEHLIQASDVSHTMQHFDIYRKWNERLFYEMYSAHRSGRTEADPSVGWYKGELWFFDNYVIPLAKKLRECRVFGVSSDECLNYATENRRLWAERGEQIVEELLQTDYISRLRRKPHRAKRRVRSKDQISEGL